MASAAPTVRSSLSAFEREPSGKLDGCFTRVNGQPATQVTALDRGLLYGDGVFEDGIQTMLTDPYVEMRMGMTAEHLAEAFEVSRAVQDEYALRSQTIASVSR